MKSASRYTAVALSILLVTAAAPALGQTAAGRKEFSVSLRAADLLSLREPGGSAAQAKDRVELFCKIMFGADKAGAVEVLAFEENPLFTYAVGELSLKSTDAQPGGKLAESPRWVRRLLLLKPAIIVVDDCVYMPGAALTWRLYSASGAELEVENRGWRITEPEGQIMIRTVLPRVSVLWWPADGTKGSDVHIIAPPGPPRTRFFHVIFLREPKAKQIRESLGGGLTPPDWVEYSMSSGDRRFHLKLPWWDAGAGEIAVEEANGAKAQLLPPRPLASGILPHTPEGLRLLEQWDGAYRGGKRPGWDTGRPSSELVRAVESGKIKPCRTLELGCGLGTNAIYLAGRKFDVSALDIAPSALAGAMERAKKAGVSVRWVLADVLAPPKIGPFDFIYDRGCYHGVRRGNAAGYVQTLRKLTRPGSLVLIEAGNANEARQYGPPRVKEEELRADFSPDFEFVELRESHFDTADPNAEGALSWFILLRRKEKP